MAEAAETPPERPTDQAVSHPISRVKTLTGPARACLPLLPALRQREAAPAGSLALPGEHLAPPDTARRRPRPSRGAYPRSGRAAPPEFARQVQNIAPLLIFMARPLHQPTALPALHPFPTRVPRAPGADPPATPRPTGRAPRTRAAACRRAPAARPSLPHQRNRRVPATPKFAWCNSASGQGPVGRQKSPRCRRKGQPMSRRRWTVEDGRTSSVPRLLHLLHREVLCPNPLGFRCLS